MEFSCDLYAQMLGLEAPWGVTSVDLKVDKSQVIVSVGFDGDKAPCPKCGKDFSLYDHAPKRQWRHLATMQFETLLEAAVPRIQCDEHGVLTMATSWSAPNSRFTLLFEAFALEVLQQTSSLSKAARLLGIDWHTAEAIRDRAVARGLARRKQQDVLWLGVDEKAFKKGHRYASIAVDLERGRVLDLVEGRTNESAESLLYSALSPRQRASVCGVAMDMWPPFIQATEKVLGDADIVHDRFHIAKHLNEAVDKVRRMEHRALRRESDETLKGTRYHWLRNPESLAPEQQASFEALANSTLKTARAWRLKELMRGFWERMTQTSAKRYFDRWYSQAIRSRLEPVKRVAKMLKKHLGNLLTYFDSFITNAKTESFNSQIKAEIANARGFRSFEGFRKAVLFRCGKLEMHP